MRSKCTGLCNVGLVSRHLPPSDCIYFLFASVICFFIDCTSASQDFLRSPLLSEHFLEVSLLPTVAKNDAPRHMIAPGLSGEQPSNMLFGLELQPLEAIINNKINSFISLIYIYTSQEGALLRKMFFFIQALLVYAQLGYELMC
ncbi:MAG: hypothetical protein ACI89T_000991 [Cognaticolwellia sp.]|jgi:hypothetical protein